MTDYKYRLIEVKPSLLESDQVNNKHLYIIQKRKFFGGWKTVYTGNYKSFALEKFYTLTDCKMPEDEVILGC